MVTSFSQLQFFDQYREAVIERLNYTNSGQRLNKLEEYNHRVKLVEKRLWNEITSYHKDELQRVIDNDIEKAAIRFDWVEIELIIQIYFRLHLDLKPHVEVVNTLIEMCVRKLTMEDYTADSAVLRQLTEYFIEVLTDYPSEANFEIIKRFYGIYIPDEYENDFLSLFRKATQLARENQSKDAKDFLQLLKTHERGIIRDMVH